MAHRFDLATLTLGAALILTACGAGTVPAGPGGTSGSGSSTGDVCALLTVDEAGGALNSPPLETSSKAGNPALCFYARPGGEQPTLTIDMTIGIQERAAEMDELIAEGYEEVQGVGDRAVSDYGTIRFLVGDRAIGVVADWGGSLNDHEAVILIGKIITARLTKGTLPPELVVTAPPVLNAKHACELLSVDEATSVLGHGPLTATGNDFGAEFAPEFCSYTAERRGHSVDLLRAQAWI